MPMNLLKGKTKCLDILERSFIVFGFVDTYKLRRPGYCAGCISPVFECKYTRFT